MKATYFHENATHSNSCICCMQPVHRFHLDIPTWDLLLIGCQAPGLLSGRPPQEMGARPQGIFLIKPPLEMGARPQGIFFGKPPQKMGARPQGIFLGEPPLKMNVEISTGPEAMRTLPVGHLPWKQSSPRAQSRDP